MSALSEKLKKMAERNFCHDCNRKFLDLFLPEIEHLLSEPISDWRQTEANIDLLWIKANGLYIAKSPTFHPCENAFQIARGEKLWQKLDTLKKKGILLDNTYEYLKQVRFIRNKIHPSSSFTTLDYILFREAKALTDAMILPIIFDLKDSIWMKGLDDIERHAKQLLEKTKIS